ncbi:hypothetical protein D7X33_08090, partial [Butyricicoccus sp. 1XD8-22]
SAPAPRACAAGGGALPLHPAPARRAPEGLAPLDSLSPPEGGERVRRFSSLRAASPPQSGGLA